MFQAFKSPLSPLSSTMPLCATELVWEIERSLSQPTFRGVPVGSALASLLHIEIWGGKGDWRLKGALMNLARFFYHHLHLRRRAELDVGFCKGRVLVTWFHPNARCRDLVFPVAKHLGYDHCVMLYTLPEMASLLPQSARGLDACQAAAFYDTWAWRRDYFRLWQVIRPLIKQKLRELSLSSCVYLRLADAVVTCTQQIAGYLEFLRRARVAALLTEYDRNGMWAPLVLSAATLGIPSYTLMHGVFADKCAGFYPLLADKIFCWGEMFADKLIAAGVDPGRTIIGGCPRLYRDLPLSQNEARMKLGLDINKPVVMLASSNFLLDRRLELTNIFCRAVHDIEGLSSLVRLHPAEKLQIYSDLTLRFPRIKFMASEECSLDQALASADVVVVHSSTVGSDALVKRRLTVVLDAVDYPLGHGHDLIDFAGCPRATSVESLQNILRCMLNDRPERQACERRREEYVKRFCAYYGDESARRIAGEILQHLTETGT